ncbi:MAG TPA: ARMT1-like domain-containing protein [Candidatus Nanoarchaeia archaeon]|nr:ARMT1-like domain-containing protein [Candidatus Nanoarchaeia archaeon]
MKIDPRCAHCLLKRVHYEAELSTDDPEIIGKAVISGLDALHRTFKPGEPAARISTAVHRATYEALDDPDPYLEIKLLSRKIAFDLMPLARSIVGDEISIDAFRRAVVVATIGNTLDFGVEGFDVKEDMFEEEFRRLYTQGLDVDDTEKMMPLLNDVVYIADNSGEILLDTLVINQIKGLGGKVTLVVRGAPMLNDATMEDIEVHGIEADRVLTTGSNAIGVCLEDAPSELVEAFGRASLIISKGMANYETMSEYGYTPIAYMLRTKCQAVADDLGLETGILVAKLCT